MEPGVDNSANYQVYAALPRALVSQRNQVFDCTLTFQQINHQSNDGVVSVACINPYAALSLIIHMLCDVIVMRDVDVTEVLQLADKYNDNSLVQYCEFLLCRQG